MSTTQTSSLPLLPYLTKVNYHFHLSTAANDDLTVVYKDKTVIVSNPTEFPELSDSSSGVREVQEPVVKATIIVPEGLLNSSLFLSLLDVSQITLAR